MNTNLFRTLISTKAVSISAIWGFAFLGHRNENKLLIEMTKNTSEYPTNYKGEPHYFYATLCTITLSLM